tara:strand:- start:683 stop:1090 length:408 start_codon:yes stop_codon:yes gene_type:complete
MKQELYERASSAREIVKGREEVDRIIDSKSKHDVRQDRMNSINSELKVLRNECDFLQQCNVVDLIKVDGLTDLAMEDEKNTKLLDSESDNNKQLSKYDNELKNLLEMIEYRENRIEMLTRHAQILQTSKSYIEIA